MERRKYIVTIGALGISSSLSGCSGDDGSDDQEGDSPDNETNSEDSAENGNESAQEDSSDEEKSEETDGQDNAEENNLIAETDIEDVINKYFTAIEEGDQEEANALVADDGEMDGVSDEEATRFKEYQYELRRTENFDINQDSALVDAYVHISTNGFNNTIIVRFELRPIDGSWKLWMSEEQPQPPEIRDAGIVSEWSSYGDIDENEISTVTEGEMANIAYQYYAFIHEGTLHLFHQVDVYDDDGDRVDQFTTENEQIFDGNGYNIFEYSVSFNTSGWGTGEFTASIRIRDEVSSDVSETYEYTFNVE